MCYFFLEILKSLQELPEYHLLISEEDISHEKVRYYVGEEMKQYQNKP